MRSEELKSSFTIIDFFNETNEKQFVSEQKKSANLKQGNDIKDLVTQNGKAKIWIDR